MLVTKLFDMLIAGNIENEEERRLFSAHAICKESVGREDYMSFDQFHLPGWCIWSGDDIIRFYNAFGDEVECFAEAIEDMYGLVLAMNKNWIMERLRDCLYDVEHENQLAFEFYLDKSSKEVVVFECWGEDSYNEQDDMIWLYRLESSFRDWDDYLRYRQGVDFEQMYITMCENAKKTYQKKAGVYWTSSDRYGRKEPVAVKQKGEQIGEIFL